MSRFILACCLTSIVIMIAGVAVRAVPDAKNADVKALSESDLVGEPAGLALDYYRLRLQDLDMIDEPPGKLKAVRFTILKDRKKTQITLRLDYTLKLFSAERAWTIETIRAANIRRIDIEMVK